MPELVTISTLNGVLYGMLLFLMASGLTLIFSMMGVLNFAHASFYMLGAFFGFLIGQLSASGRLSSSRRCWSVQHAIGASSGVIRAVDDKIFCDIPDIRA